METGVRFAANPSSSLRLTLAQWMGCQRFIYNAKVEETQYHRTFQRKALALTGIYPPQDQQYSHFKDRELTPWLYEVPSEILRNGAVRYQQAWSRYQKRLSARPRFKKKSHRQSVWLTSELFRFVEDGHGYRLYLGKKGVLGELPFTAHRDYKLPNSLVISRQGGKWYVAFCYEDGQVIPDEAAVIAHYSALDEATLSRISKGYDRGVEVPIMSDSGEGFVFSPEQIRNLERLETRRQHYERKMARCQKGSKRHQKARCRIARHHARVANTRREFSHQWSHRQADSAAEVFVGEKLQIQSMVRKPAPQPMLDANGEPIRDASGTLRYALNGRKAKAGLSKSILSSCWGQSWTFLCYKAHKKGKLAIRVPAKNSSLECAECGHTCKENRPERAVFHCVNCQHQDHADRNAARVVRSRGIKQLLEGQVKASTKKKTLRMARKQNTVGQDMSKRERESAQKARSGSDANTTCRSGGGDRVRLQEGLPSGARVVETRNPCLNQ